MSDQERREFLEDGHTAVLTTLRKDGRPSAVPLWYVMVNGSMIPFPPGMTNDPCGAVGWVGEA